MPTKLSRYADGVMEAAWLAAVVVIPLFLNIYSSRIFEPDKITFVRTLALFILAAWIVKVIESGVPQWGSGHQDDSLIKRILRVPLIAPIVAFVVVMVIATIFSVVPRISIFGSYQRLQGTYTTFAYLTIFFAILVNLRQRAQVNRLITTMIMVSLPVSLYGVLQRYEIDPVPWAGDVTIRVASNMGNSIFVAAYLIMISPLTFGRIVESFGAILRDEDRLVPHFARATAYVFVASLQLIAIYLTGSRGPLLGLLAGLFLLFLLLSLHWRKRWLTLTTIGVAGAVGLFLIVLSIPGGPLKGLSSSPWIGRFGKVFDLGQRSNRVRTLIWSGAAEMVFPHEPLDFPDGSTDPFNFLRPLIGYGPESMHVAYNKFFPPELAQIENRNASPDRSHNETWDALVTTGVIGLVVYLILFAAIFYYGLKWLGLVRNVRQRNLLLVLFFGGGVISAVGFGLTLGIGFLGVGLPFGAIIGLIIYITLIALFTRTEGPQMDTARALTLMVLLAGIVAHFVEINFGIAIVATRTHFWVFAGLMLVVGYVLPAQGVFSEISDAPEDSKPVGQKTKRASGKGRRKKRRRGERRAYRGDRDWVRGAIIGGLLSALILIPLGYAYVSVQRLPITSPAAIWASFTSLPNKDGATSFGVLTLLLTLWIVSGIVFVSETNQDGLNLNALGVVLGISAVVAFLYYLLHTGGLINVAIRGTDSQQDIIERTFLQSTMFEGLLTRFYIYVLLVLLVLGRVLPAEWPRRVLGGSGMGTVIAPTIFILAFALAYFTNVRIIHADMAFKLADPLSRNQQYESAVNLYDRANRFAFAEDHYYLFLGKANLEWAGTISNPEEQNKQVEKAELSLKRAQVINPLNTDHTANLARLYRWWASRAPNADVRAERAEISADFYERALTLSPNNAALWGEWGSLFLTVAKDLDQTLETLTHGLEVDPIYEATHALLGDYYLQDSRDQEYGLNREDALEQAAYHYEQAITNLLPRDQGSSQKRYTYRIALAGTYQELERLEDAIAMYQESIDVAPRNTEIWRVQEVIASLYATLGDRANALAYATILLGTAPDSEQARIQNFISQLQANP